ncbi:hypothetical protein UFOVP1613_23 [uncultured Caudovirales phage]|uniref:Uncharacterized protein n=1 Tax=uncultured Caudovirales phage TaxID=2100421 RepID=A0A6J5QYA2_9CAUD|nr:hypothetical protein UFOVP1163_25 [uncultured Caudovirales phage]CAB4219277.1 hypothetical protein UFOVP1613_23 [uncultured Caudovirales phage]
MTTNTIKLELEIPEVNFLLEALGEMPAKTNASFLMLKIKTQGEPQVPDELKLKE